MRSDQTTADFWSGPRDQIRSVWIRPDQTRPDRIDILDVYIPPLRDDEDEAVEAAFGDIGSRGFDFPPEYAKADVGCAGEDEADEDVAEA